MPATLSRRDKIVLLLFVLLIGAVVGLVYWSAHKQHDYTGPGSMALDAQGRLWAEVDGEFFIVNSEGSTEMRIDTRALGIQLPIAAIAAYGKDQMLIGSRANGEIYQVNAATKIASPLSAKDHDARKPFGAFHLHYNPASEQIVMTDVSNHRALLLAKDGSVVKQLGSRNNAPGEFHFPNGIATDASGRLLIVDTNHFRIALLDQQLNPVSGWVVKRTDSGNLFPAFIDVDAHGKVYVTIHDHNLEYGDLVRLSADGELEQIYRLPAPMKINGLKVRGEAILIADQATHRIYQISEGGAEVKPFGDAQLQQAFTESAAARQRYTLLVLWARRAMYILGVLLLITLMVLRRREALAAAATPLAVEAEVKPAFHFTARMKQALLLAPVLAMSYMVLFVLIWSFITLISAGAAAAMTIVGIGSLTLLPLVAVGLWARHAYGKRSLAGSYHALYKSQAAKLLNYHRKAVARALNPGEKVVDHTVGLAGTLPALVVLTPARLLLFTTTLLGPHLRRIQSLPRAAVLRATVAKAGKMVSFFRFMGIPMWRITMTLADRRSTYVLYFQDGFAAAKLAGAMEWAGQTATSAAVDLPCENCARPGRSLALAMLLSAVSPGLGQLYNQEMFRGLVMLLVFWSMAIATMRPVLAAIMKTQEVSSVTVISTLATLAILWLFGMAETYYMSRRNVRNEVGLVPRPLQF